LRLRSGERYALLALQRYLDRYPDDKGAQRMLAQVKARSERSK